MKYELAKKLKDAGFPFKNQQGYEYRHCEGHADSLEDWDDYMGKCSGIGDSGPCSCIRHNLPTLEELIEACGERFAFVLKHATHSDDGTPLKESIPWIASDSPGKITTSGSTPLEAVANLWLELNKK